MSKAKGPLPYIKIDGQYIVLAHIVCFSLTSSGNSTFVYTTANDNILLDGDCTAQIAAALANSPIPKQGGKCE